MQFLFPSLLSTDLELIQPFQNLGLDGFFPKLKVSTEQVGKKMC